MADPLVSIVIPTYNRALLGPDSVRSALSQSYPRCEVIVADDGSTDDTVARLEREFGAAIRIVRQQHAGPAVARNAGIHAVVVRTGKVDPGTLPEVARHHVPVFASFAAFVATLA